MNWLRFVSLILVVPLFSFLLSGCKFSGASDDEESTKKIYIGVAWPEEEQLFVSGARLAANEANESGGVLGKQIQLVVDGSEAKITEILKKTSSLSLGENTKEISRVVARRFSDHSPKLAAVVGHRYSLLAITAANIYHQQELLYIAPTATNLLLTTLGFNLVFRMLPNNDALGKQLAIDAKNYNASQIAVLNDYSDYALELSTSFIQSASEIHSIVSSYKHSFFENTKDSEIAQIAVELKKLEKHKEKGFQEIVLFTSQSLANKIYQQVRDRGGVNVPIIGSESFDNASFWNTLIEWSRKRKRLPNIFIPTIYFPNTPIAKRFIQHFQEVYKKKPDRYAAIGYDTIKVLLHAIQIAKDTDSFKIADELRYMPPCLGVTGPLSFHENGDIKARRIYLKGLEKDHFSYSIIEGENSIIGQNKGMVECGRSDQPQKSFSEGDPHTLCLETGKTITEKSVSEDYPDCLDLDDYSKENRSDENSRDSRRSVAVSPTPPLSQTASSAPSSRSSQEDSRAEGKAQPSDQASSDKEATDAPTEKPDTASVSMSIDATSQEAAKIAPPQNEKTGVVATEQQKAEGNLLAIPQDTALQEAVLPSLVKKEPPSQSDISGQDHGNIPGAKDLCAQETSKGVQRSTDDQNCAKSELTYVVSGAIFSSGQAAFAKGATAKDLDRFIAEIASQPILSLEVTGHTDNRGKPQKNIILSEQRAQAIARYLTQHGIKADKITIVGRGSSQPLTSNKTPAGREKNRRVEVKATVVRR